MKLTLKSVIKRQSWNVKAIVFLCYNVLKLLLFDVNDGTNLHAKFTYVPRGPILLFASEINIAIDISDVGY